MVCTTQDLLEWKDFPKGLKVLLLDKDVTYSAEIKSKLEGMDYIVTTFYHESEALSVVLNKSEVFHVAIVEVSTIDFNGNFNFLQIAKGLPTIMIANTQSLSMTMKCITLGAIEVLSKPLSEDKLRNIWQHVVHKAYNAGDNDTAVSTRLLNEQEKLEELRVEIPCMFNDRCDHEQDCSSGNDKYPAPSTPQLKQVRLQDNAEEHYEKSKSVETTCCNAANIMHIEALQPMPDGPVKEENDLGDGCKSESDTSPHPRSGPETSPCGGNATTQPMASESRGPCGPKNNLKKMKVDWTSDLHKKFVHAVEQLGVEQAIPSLILELMKVEGLTRHNVASHLQKYRMQRRHTLPNKEERRIALRPKDNTQNNYYYQYKPIMSYPPPQPYHSNQPVLGNQGHPMWVQPGGHTAAFQSWGGPAYQNWPWKSYPSMQADVWGCPVMPTLHGSYSHYPHNSGCYSGVTTSDQNMSSISHGDHLADEVFDKIIKEAINKPLAPLPIGLKPPSTESVLVELSKKGISNIPPYSL